VSAAGHRPWEETRVLTAGATWEIRPELTPIRRAADGREPPRRDEPPPAREEPPQVVLQAIRTFFQEGKAAHDQGRYVQAAERYRRGLQYVLEAEGEYRRQGALARLRRELQNALSASIEACNLEGQANCPKP
jgi:hypothetical protein